jgi:Ca2+-binding EF-hand superfamily protein
MEELNKMIYKNWTNFNKNIPVEETEEAKNGRINLFKEIDINSNGSLSISEIHLVIKHKIDYHNPHLKSAIFKSFETIRLLRDEKSKLNRDDHFLIFREFRKFLVYLKHYFEYYLMFELMDSDDTRKVDIYEFEAALSFIKRWGIEIKDIKKSFNEIDDNNSGVITFDEFCFWAIKNSLKIPIEDD